MARPCGRKFMWIGSLVCAAVLTSGAAAEDGNVRANAPAPGIEKASDAAAQASTMPDVATAADALSHAADDIEALSRRIVEAAGVPAGRFLAPAEGGQRIDVLVVDGSEALSVALARQSQVLRIHLVCESAERVERMRTEIDRAGLYGRITCRAEESASIFLPTYFFDLVIVNRMRLGQRRFGEVFRLLKPASGRSFSATARRPTGSGRPMRRARHRPWRPRRGT